MSDQPGIPSDAVSAHWPASPAGGDPIEKASGENFPVALRLLPPRTREDLWALYRYARHVDDLGDEWAGDRLSALDRIEADVRGLYEERRPPDDPVVAALASTIARRRLPADPLLRLIEANRWDQQVTRYETFDDLLAYCRLSANPVGELVLHIFGRATPERVALSDRVCTALQLLEHWQDVAEDYRRGRVYLPQEDLRRFGVAEEDLARPTATSQVRALIAFEAQRAEAWLDAGAALVTGLSGRARLAVSGYIAGGRAAAAALRRSDYDPLSRVPKPTSRQIASAWLRSVIRGWG
jgi:squalene synthase HpnC